MRLGRVKRVNAVVGVLQEAIAKFAAMVIG
jgi:hypothetical protein